MSRPINQISFFLGLLSVFADFASADLVQIRLEVADSFNQPISHVVVGQQLKLSGFVRDLRPPPFDDGVAAAYLDVVYDSTLAFVNGPITFGLDFPLFQSGTVAPNLIDEVGAFDGIAPPYRGERLLFQVPFQAISIGLLTFRSDPADEALSHDVLLYGLSTAVPVNQIAYGTASLSIVPEPSVLVLTCGIGLGSMMRRRRTLKLAL